MLSTHLFVLHGKALSVRLSHEWAGAQPVFDDEHLVSHAGLVPVMALAERAGLSELIDSRVRFRTTRVKSAGVNPAGKITSIVAGMAAGADCIDDLNVLRAGGMARMFGGVYALATLGSVPAGVHPWPQPAAGIGAARPPGRPGRDAPRLLPGRDRRAFAGHRFTAAPGLRPRQAGRVLRDIPRSPAGRYCARACPRRSPPSAPMTGRR